MQLVYVTSRYPFGQGEAFLGPEITSHLLAGVDVCVFPMLPKGEVVHADGALLGASERPEGGVGALGTLRLGLGGLEAWREVLSLLSRRQDLRSRARNLAVMARLGKLIEILERRRPDHLHVHWGGASSTLAMVAAEAVGVPWSMTLHRWDIHTNNLLEVKTRSASFTRVISKAAANDLNRIAPRARPHVIHMGVDVPDPVRRVRRRDGSCRLVCIASLVPVKNHLVLLDAFAALPSDRDVRLDLVGGGPLASKIAKSIATRGLSGRVRLMGALPHPEVLYRLRSGEWDGAVLASKADQIEHEGVPVSLMEAMAAGVPVIATDSGGTDELLGQSAGLLVPAGEQRELARALTRFVSDSALRKHLSTAGRARVEEAFDVRRIGEQLRSLFMSHTLGAEIDP